MAGQQKYFRRELEATERATKSALQTVWITSVLQICADKTESPIFEPYL
jgi:hypothetical protein